MAMIASLCYLTVIFIQTIRKKSLKIAIIVTVGEIVFEKALRKRNDSVA